jgi:hypothetical protein
MSRRGVSLTRLAAEVVSVVFAVLVALALDEWWEDRENAANARASLVAIAEEMRENRDELAPGDSAEVGTMMENLDSAIAIFDRGERPEGASVNWELALLSSAAWETAQISRATTHMELGQVVNLAQVYEFQRYYSRIQDGLFDAISGLRAGDEIADELRGLRSRMATALGLRASLADLYSCTLVALEGPDIPEADDCSSAREDGAG